MPKHSYKKAQQEHIAIPNVLDSQFNPSQPSKIWGGDLTYIWTGSHWAYFAVVLDLFARKPVGWAISYSPDTALTTKALTMAHELGGKPKDLLLHSDQDTRYTSVK